MLGLLFPMNAGRKYTCTGNQALLCTEHISNSSSCHEADQKDNMLQLSSPGKADH